MLDVGTRPTICTKLQLQSNDRFWGKMPRHARCLPASPARLINEQSICSKDKWNGNIARG